MAAPTTTVSCPGGKWTQVTWQVGLPVLSYHYFTSPSTHVNWRWFSAGVPPYWQGSFTGDAVITLLGGVYTSLEFNPDAGTTVTIRVL